METKNLHHKVKILFCFFLTSLTGSTFAGNERCRDQECSKSWYYYEKSVKANVYIKSAMAYSQSEILRLQQSTINFENIFYDLFDLYDKDTLLAARLALETNSIQNTLDGSNSSKCNQDIARIIFSTLNGESWPISFLDASGKPGPSITKGWLYFIGNYDQCKEASSPTMNESVGFRGIYCSLPVLLNGIPLPNPPNIGLCLPDSCSESDTISRVLQNLLGTLNVTSVSVGNLQRHSGKTEITHWTIAAILILCVVGVFVITGSFYDFVFVQRKNSDYEVINSEQSSDDYDEKTCLLPKIDTKHTLPCYNSLMTFLQCFSLYTNGKKLLKAASPPGSIDSIHGIRFISMSWVILGHCFVVGGVLFSINFTAEIQKYLERWTFTAVANALVSVDTFFTLSGLLTSYIYIDEIINRNGPWKINWLMFYFHRIWRLSPPYISALILYIGLQQFMGSGALWSDTQPIDKEQCENNWWTNMLYINNLVHASSAACFAHTWYLANDMQFFLISPILIIPFYYHWVAGVLSCSFTLLLSWIVTGVLSTENNWSSTIVGVTAGDFFTDYYIKPWCRIGPYIVGILTGFILLQTRGKRLNLKPAYVLIGWFVATVSALAVVYGSYFELRGYNIPNTATRAFYNSVSRSVWGACVSWVILACTWGYGGPVNSILSWSPFIVLGRLTYCTYLTHFNLLFVFFANMGLMFFLNNTTIAIIFLGLLVFCNAVGFVHSLLFESPFLALEKAFIRKKD